jgi:hypothetical protein
MFDLNIKIVLFSTSDLHFVFLCLIIIVVLITNCEVLNCYTGDRGAAWHGHCWSCNFIFISSYLHSSCPPRSTRLCWSSLGMFHFIFFVHIHVNLLFHTMYLVSMQTLFYLLNSWQYFLCRQRMTDYFFLEYNDRLYW